MANDFLSDIMWGRTPIRLIGGYSCTINTDEANEWRLFIGSHPAYINLNCLTARQNAFMHKGEPDAAATLVKDIAAAELELFHVAKDWYAELEARRIQDAPGSPEATNREAKPVSSTELTSKEEE